MAVVCAAGNRAALAVSILRRDGISNVVHIADGGVADLEGHQITLTKEDGHK